eukprot:m.26444 g.26444  ORF g.26444 m.26444 type:complete len:583 (+) comp15404_c0_seq1:124-1872(+)
MIERNKLGFLIFILVFTKNGCCVEHDSEGKIRTLINNQNMDADQQPVDASGDDTSNQDNNAKTTNEKVLGVVKDSLPAVSSIANWAFDATRFGVRMGFSFGESAMSIVSNSGVVGTATTMALGAVGVVGAPVVVGVAATTAVAKGLEYGLKAARVATIGGLDIGKKITEASIDTTDTLLDSYGIESGSGVRLAFGDDTGTAMILVKRVSEDIGITEPPAGMTWGEMTHTVGNLAWVQYAAKFGKPVQRPSCTTTVNRVDLQRYFRFAVAMYGHLQLKFLRILPLVGGVANDLDGIKYLTGIDAAGADMVGCDWSSSIYRPGYCIVLDRATKAVVLMIRGTLSMHDVLTDLVCAEAEFRSGTSHGGMLSSAKRFNEEVMDTIEQALRQNEGFKLVICGHSLGAGIATLLASLLGPVHMFPAENPSDAPHKVVVECYAYAPPCVLSLELARSVAPFVTSVVIGNDMVPRFGKKATVDLKAALGRLHQSPELMAQITERRTAEGKNVPDSTRVWAMGVLAKIKLEIGGGARLHPAGTIVYMSGKDSSFDHVIADADQFDGMLFSGSSMFSSHMPQAYITALDIKL